VLERLRALREASGKSLDQVGHETHSSAAAVSRLLNAQTGAPADRYVRDIAGAYGASNEDREQLLRVLAAARAGWRQYTAGPESTGADANGLKDASQAEVAAVDPEDEVSHSRRRRVVLLIGAAVVVVAVISASLVKLAIDGSAGSGASESSPPTTTPAGGPSSGLPTATIDSPVNGQKISLPNVLQLTGNIASVDGRFCASHHLWLIGKFPSGRNGEPLYIAQKELPCRAGAWSYRVEITVFTYHEYRVESVPNGPSESQMEKNKRAADEHDYQYDGEWVELPVGHELVSNIVRVVH